MSKKFVTPEAEARYILDQCGVEDAEHYTAGDVVGLANLLVERDRMRARVAELEDRLFEFGAMEDGPCFVCGYNGAGYYQPAKHPCAERHHRLTRD